MTANSALMEPDTRMRGGNRHLRKPAVRSPRTAQSESGPIIALSLLTHDLRGPLSNLALLMESIDDAITRRAFDRVEPYTRRAYRTVERMTDMLMAMLRRVRAVDDPLGIAGEPVNLSDVVETVAALNEPLARQANVRIRTYCAEPLFVAGDRDLLLQAIDNLVNNAIRHTRLGGMVVCEAAADNDEAVVTISDQGNGLAAATQKNLFRPTAGSSIQVDPTSTSASTSIGLGLWIVSVIAARHGGTVEADNIPGRGGAVFTIRLPIDAS